MFGNDHFLVSEVPAVKVHPEVEQKTPLKLVADQHLREGIWQRALDMVMRDQRVDEQTAKAMLAHFWMASVGIEPLGKNPLLNPAEYGQGQETPVDKLRGIGRWLLSE